MKYLNRTGGAALAALVLTFTASSALAQRTVLMDWG